jgi:hypothetical protein
LVTQVITMCSLEHSQVWKLTSALLPENIIADEYLVYVPDDEISMFKEFTNPKISVRSQSELGTLYFDHLREKLVQSGNEIRFGWYLQQFYKIEALLASTADRLVIWDADCVPVRPIQTFDSSGCPIYMFGAFEYNESYFEAIERLTGLSRVQEFSFVIPGFPILKQWIDEFEKYISLRNNEKPWYDAVIETTDFALKSGFSETETLGTFVANLHPQEWSTFEGSWERRGQKRFGYAQKFTPALVVKIATESNLDIISFENWDVRGPRLIVKRLRERWQAFKGVRK